MAAGGLNIAFRITGDYEDACEVTQDAFVAAYKGIGSFRDASRFSTWLTSITVNLSRNRLQQIQAKRRNEAYSVELSCPAPSALDRLERLDRQAETDRHASRPAAGS